MYPRRAKNSDAEEITNLVKVAYQPYLTSIGITPGPVFENYQHTIACHDVFVVEKNDSLVGVLVLKKGASDFLLDNIAVHPSNQNQGIGRILLELAEEKARQHGFTSIVLYTHQKMIENISLYVRIGYKEFKRVTENGYQRVYMRKILASASSAQPPRSVQASRHSSAEVSGGQQKTSPMANVRELYDDTASRYSAMMDTEIELPIYVDTLGRLADRIANISGPLIDTSCGSGHMLSSYHACYDSERSLLGLDLSPRMVAIARTRLGSDAVVQSGDMRKLQSVESVSAAAVLSFFAIHHLDASDVLAALKEWHRVLQSGGQLVVAAWEGAGSIDYGDQSDVVALRYRKKELTAWATEAGFVVNRCIVDPVDGMAMDAVYLEGAKK